MEGRHWEGAKVFRPNIIKKNIGGELPSNIDAPCYRFPGTLGFFLQGDKKYAATTNFSVLFKHRLRFDDSHLKIRTLLLFVFEFYKYQGRIPLREN
jgi:hypothetical protein